MFFTLLPVLRIDFEFELHFYSWIQNFVIIIKHQQISLIISFKDHEIMVM